mmetsp:Transcript_74028/g.130820  ORF Transcript_74028/g.130820 Transcript_74028/m.130820 type:complete len:268 (+) Transcript_74028:90-893(+)
MTRVRPLRRLSSASPAVQIHHASLLFPWARHWHLDELQTVTLSCHIVEYQATTRLCGTGSPRTVSPSQNSVWKTPQRTALELHAEEGSLGCLCARGKAVRSRQPCKSSCLSTARSKRRHLWSRSSSTVMACQMRTMSGGKVADGCTKESWGKVHLASSTRLQMLAASLVTLLQSRFQKLPKGQSQRQSCVMPSSCTEKPSGPCRGFTTLAMLVTAQTRLICLCATWRITQGSGLTAWILIKRDHSSSLPIFAGTSSGLLSRCRRILM